MLCSRMWLVILRNFLRMQLCKRAKGLRVYGSGLEVWCSKLGSGISVFGSGVQVG